MNYTKTINPLHFEDLDPHRFEDLVRQIIYDFKDWKSIEATGRMGADDGIDILAVETKVVSTDEIKKEFRVEELTWIIQCKREKTISPKKIIKIIENDIDKQGEIPYGYIIVASSNFSKKARDNFKYRLNEYGVQEFYLFGKSELEDILFQPKYDHLLFAYFGLSIQKRKRSIKSKLSSNYILKKRLFKVVGGLEELQNKIVLIKDASAENYPFIVKDKITTWRYYECALYEPVNCISFFTKKHMAYLDFIKKEWDIIEVYDESFPQYPQLFGLSEEFYEGLNANYYKAFEQWDKVDAIKKGWFYEVKSIPFERILLIDEIGDKFNTEIQLTVDFKNGDPFELRTFHYLLNLNSSDFLKCEVGKKIEFFK